MNNRFNKFKDLPHEDQEEIKKQVAMVLEIIEPIVPVKEGGLTASHTDIPNNEKIEEDYTGYKLS